MKSKRFIELLQKEDPSGEAELCVGNEDIFFLEGQTAYWDGCLQVLKRDETSKYYNITGAKYVSTGSKVNIRTLSIEDAIGNDPDLPVEFDSDYTRYHYADQIAAWREETRKIEKQFEDEFIVKVLRKYQEGWKAAQAQKEPVTHSNVQWWWKPDDKRTRRSYSSEEGYGGQLSLCQGECRAIIHSGFFLPVDDGKRIVWELQFLVKSTPEKVV